MIREKLKKKLKWKRFPFVHTKTCYFQANFLREVRCKNQRTDELTDSSCFLLCTKFPPFPPLTIFKQLQIIQSISKRPVSKQTFLHRVIFEITKGSKKNPCRIYDSIINIVKRPSWRITKLFQFEKCRRPFLSHHRVQQKTRNVRS